MATTNETFSKKFEIAHKGRESELTKEEIERLYWRQWLRYCQIGYQAIRAGNDAKAETAFFRGKHYVDVFYPAF